MTSNRRWPSAWAALTATAALMSGCAGLLDSDPAPTTLPHTLLAVLDDGRLIRVNAGNPSQALHSVPLSGLRAGERLVGIDFRVARGVLYGLSSEGRLFTINTTNGQLTSVGNSPVALQGQRFGFDFNPTVDRIRVVSDTGQNLRLHPDTGALVSSDTPLKAAQAISIVAAGYTYNKQNDKITTNFAIDARAGSLVRQGSAEGVQPVVSPNTGQIQAVGELGTGPVDEVSFDIADTDNLAVAALTQGGRTRLYRVDLATGRANVLGTLSRGVAVRGIAIEP
jgi:Domain of unknown function (DUF4394)